SVLLALVFVAGVATGVFYERPHDRAHQAVATDVHGLLHGLTRDLDLTAAQQDTIDQILARHQRDVDSSWRVMQPRVHAALDAAVEEIAGVLTPAQAAKFRTLMDGRHPEARH